MAKGVNHKWPVQEAAVVTTDSLSDLALCCPQLPENSGMPMAVQFLAACVLKWRRDDAFVQQVIEWYQDEIRAMKENYH